MQRQSSLCLKKVAANGTLVPLIPDFFDMVSVGVPGADVNGGERGIAELALRARLFFI